MTKFERAALSFTKYTEALKKFEPVLSNTPIVETALLERRLKHRKDLQEEIAYAYGEMLEFLSVQEAKQDELLARMSQLAQDAGAYD
jgi:hypothetical protein